MARAQAMLFVIIAIVLLLLSSIYLYLGKSAALKQIAQQTHKTYTSVNEIKPIADYMNECTATLSQDALEKIGLQGGTLYASQGGTTPDLADTFNGAFFILHQGHKVNYGITSQQVTLPDYPSTAYPSSSPLPSGISSLPLLVGDGNAIQHQIERYVVEHIDECFVQELFEEQGYSFEKGQPSATVEFANTALSITLEYPLKITNNLTQERAEMTTFSAKHSIRFNEFYNALAHLINEDITDFTFDISKPTGLPQGMSTLVVRNAYEHDDIIQLIDQNSLLGGKPYVFQFARNNRNPALHLFSTTTILPDIPTEEGPLAASITVDMFSSPVADDPDEDDVSFQFVISNKVDDDGNMVVLDSTPQSLDTPDGYLTVRIIATDAELQDYQEITIQRA